MPEAVERARAAAVALARDACLRHRPVEHLPSVRVVQVAALLELEHQPLVAGRRVPVGEQLARLRHQMHRPGLGVLRAVDLDTVRELPPHLQLAVQETHVRPAERRELAVTEPGQHRQPAEVQVNGPLLKLRPQPAQLVVREERRPPLRRLRPRAPIEPPDRIGREQPVGDRRLEARGEMPEMLRERCRRHLSRDQLPAHRIAPLPLLAVVRLD